MKNVARTLALLLAAAGSFAAPAKAPYSAAPFPAGAAARIVGSISGTVYVRKRGGERFFAVSTAPLALDGGETVRTGPQGSAVVVFADGSRVDLGPNAALWVEKQSSELIALYLTLGRLRAAVARRSGRAFRVRTPTAIASVRGTVFSVEVPTAERSRVSVEEGLVAVRALRTRRLARRSVTLGARATVTVTSGGLGRVTFGTLGEFPPSGAELPKRD